MPNKANVKNQELRTRLRATIKANRISRLGCREAEAILKDLEKQRNTTLGTRKEYLDTLISVLDEKLEEKAEASAQQSLGGEIGGGCGFDSGSCNTGD